MSEPLRGLVRRTIKTLVRKAPLFRPLFNRLDALRADHAALIVAHSQAVSAWEQAEKARLKAERARDVAEAAVAVATGKRPANKAKKPVVLKPDGPVDEDDNRPVEANIKISVLLPHYNHGAFISQNIEAVLAQTYPNWELVVVDDGSTDGSQETIRSFAQRDQRIVPIFHPENRGVIAAIDTGRVAMTGTLVYGSAADDHISSNRFFERAVRALVRHPSATGVFGKAQVIDASTGKNLWEMGLSPAHGFIPPALALDAFLHGKFFVPGAAAIWKRTYVEAVGGFDHRLGPQTDYFVNHALPALGGVVFIDEVFATVRTGDTNYHHAGDQSDFFKRHGLVECKLRELDLPIPPDPEALRAWREHLIAGHLAVARQHAFFNGVRAALMDIEPWERAALSEDFLDYSQRVLADVAKLEKDLADRVASAHGTLDSVAGPIPDGKSPANPARQSGPPHP